MGYSHLSDTEAPKIPTFQGSKNSDTVLGWAPKCPTAENWQFFFNENWTFSRTKTKFLKKKIYKLMEQVLVYVMVQYLCTKA